MTTPTSRGRTLRRLAKRAWVVVAYAGSAVTCPVCERSFRAFRTFHGRPQAQCPNCGSLERHRLLWLYLQREVLDAGSPTSTLHVAPEAMIADRLRARSLAYLAFDWSSPIADVHGDLCAAPFADGAFDLVVCSHVLEHIVEDRRAIAEIDRLLAPGGVAVIQVPVEHGRTQTFEDASVTEPQDRLAVFGQADHVRIYGSDVVERLRATGMSVEVVDYRQALGPAAKRYAALAPETIFVCTHGEP